MAMGFEPQEHPHWAKEAFAGESGYVEPVKVKKIKVKRHYVKRNYTEDWKKSVFEPKE
tara:strand:- start:2303 stop:2476 length:174 start_codon:yes stop_codon:yes gene_type:complete